MPVDIDRLEALDKAATAGPWSVASISNEDGYGHEIVLSRGVCGANGRSINGGDDYELFGEADADLIAEVRTALPDLLAELRAARAAVAALQGFDPAAARAVLEAVVERGRLDLAVWTTPHDFEVWISAKSKANFELCKAIEQFFATTNQEPTP